MKERVYVFEVVRKSNTTSSPNVQLNVVADSLADAQEKARGFVRLPSDEYSLVLVSSNSTNTD